MNKAYYKATEFSQEILLEGYKRKIQEKSFACKEQVIWGAAHFWAAVLAKSERTAPSLNESRVKELFSDFNEKEKTTFLFDEWKNKNTICFVLDRLEIPRGPLRKASRDIQSEESKFLHILNEENNRSGCFWISKKNITELYETHKKTFQNSPSFTKFEKGPTLKEFTKNGEKGYIIESLEPNSLFVQSVAFYWEHLICSSMTTTTDCDKLLVKWLDVDTISSYWFNVADYLTDEGREKFLAEALDLIVNEKDFGDFQTEVNRCYRENERMDGRTNNNKLIPEGLYAIYLTWQKELMQFYEYGYWETRNTLNALIAIIIRNDSNNYMRIEKLLETSIEKPYLVVPLSQMILPNNPFSAPRLICNPLFTSFMLAIVEDTAIVSDKDHKIKNAIWTNCIAIALEVSERLLITSNSNTYIHFGDIILQLNTSLEKGKPHNQYSFGVQTRLDILLDLLKNKQLNIRTNLTKTTFIFPLLARHIVNYLNESIKSEKGFYATFSSEINSLFQLYTIAEDYLDSDWDSTIQSLLGEQLSVSKSDVLTSISVTIIKAVATSLDSSKDKYRWINQRGFNNWPWYKIINTIDLERINNMLPLASILNELKIESGKELETKNDKFDYSIYRSIVHRYRFVLGILLSFSIAKKARSCDKLNSLIKDSIIELKGIKRGMLKQSPFSQEFEVETYSPLIPLLADFLNLIPLVVRQSVVKEVVTSIDDVWATINLSERLVPDELRKEILKNITEDKIKKFNTENTWIKHTENLCRALLDINNIELFKVALDSGNELPREHPYWNSWVKFVDEVSMYRLFLEKNTEGINTYQYKTTNDFCLSEKQTQKIKDNQITELDKLKNLYKNLIKIDNNPEVVLSDKSFYSTEDQSIEIGFAIFRAKLSCYETQKIDYNAMKQSYYDWQEKRNKYSDNDLDDKFKRSIAYYEFKTVAILNIDSDFNSMLEKFYVPIHTDCDFFTIAKERLEKINPDLAQALIKEVRQKNIDIEGKLSNEFSIIEQKNFSHKPLEALKLVNTKSDASEYKELRDAYSRIYSPSRSEDELSRIIKQSETATFPELLFEEIISACNILIDRRSIINKLEVKEEDTYNQLLASFLSLAFSPRPWAVGDQSEGGETFKSSRKTKKGGTSSRDIVIKNNVNLIAGIECLRYYMSKPEKEKHFRKVFQNVSCFNRYIIAFIDDNRTETLSDLWTEYTQIIKETDYKKNLNEVSLSEGPNELLDVPLRIKAAKCVFNEYSRESIVYHILVDLRCNT